MHKNIQNSKSYDDKLDIMVAYKTCHINSLVIGKHKVLLEYFTHIIRLYRSRIDWCLTDYF